MISRILGPRLVACDEIKRSKDQPEAANPDSMIGLIKSNFTGSFVDKTTQVLSKPETYYGFTAGACTGFALKKVAKAAAFTFGAVFMGFQLAAHSGYVKVNWDVIERDVKKYLPDQPADEARMIDRSVEWLTTNTGLAATVFTAGFVSGLKLG